MLADTAATKPAPPSTKYSSFGEFHGKVRGEHVEESLLKIVPIGAGVVVAFAGDVQLATEYLDFLRDNRPFAKNNIELLKSLTASAGPFTSDQAVALLLASSAPDGSCELLRWSTTHGIDHSGSDYYEIGSLTSHHAALTPALLSVLVTYKLDSARMLAVVTATVQSYGIHDNLIDMNVGGLIFGVQTSYGVAAWQQDTNYVIYDQTLSKPAFVTAIARDNALVVSSSLTSETRVFAHSTSTILNNLLDKNWLLDVKGQLDSGHSRYWIFISTAWKVITLVNRRNLNIESRFVKCTNLGKGKFNLAVSDDLKKLLLNPLVDHGPQSVPFRLNVRDD